MYIWVLHWSYLFVLYIPDAVTVCVCYTHVSQTQSLCMPHVVRVYPKRSHCMCVLYSYILDAVSVCIAQVYPRRSHCLCVSYMYIPDTVSVCVVLVYPRRSHPGLVACHVLLSCSYICLVIFYPLTGWHMQLPPIEKALTLSPQILIVVWNGRDCTTASVMPLTYLDKSFCSVTYWRLTQNCYIFDAELWHSAAPVFACCKQEERGWNRCP